MNFQFTSSLWEYAAETSGSWYFITVPKEYTEEIQARTSDYKKGFGSVKVTVSIGDTTWETSLFPDSKLGCYLLPVKKEVRTKEQLVTNGEYLVKVVLKV